LKFKSYPKFWKKVGMLGNISLIFSVLSAISKLSSWQEFIAFLTNKLSQITNIVRFLGKLIDWILIPYNWIIELLYSILPLNIPDNWQDPIIIGIFIIFYPITELLFFLSSSYQNSIKKTIKKLKKLSLIVPRQEQYEQLADELQKLINQEDEFFIALMTGTPSNYIRALRTKNETDIAQKRTAFKEYLKGDVFKKLIQDDNSSKKELKKSRNRALFACIFTILIALDFAYINSTFNIFGILLRSIVVMLSFGLFPILGIFILGFVFSKICGFIYFVASKIIPPEKLKYFVRKIGIKIFASAIGDLMPESWHYKPYINLTQKTSSELNSKEFKISKLDKLFSPDEVDIYVNKKTFETYFFYKKHLNVKIHFVIYLIKQNELILVIDDNQFYHLGVKINNLVHKYIRKAYSLQFIRTENGESVEGITVYKYNFKRKYST